MIACTKCGSNSDSRANHCSKCGHKLLQNPSSLSISTQIQTATSENSLTGSRSDFMHYFVERTGRMGLSYIIRDQGGNILLKTKRIAGFGYKYKALDSNEMEIGRINVSADGSDSKVLNQSKSEIASIRCNLWKASSGEMQIQTPQAQYTIVDKILVDGIVLEAMDKQDELAFQLIERSGGQLWIESKGKISPSILGMICMPLLANLKLKIDAYKRLMKHGSVYDQYIKKPEPVILVEDQIYNDNDPVIFSIKRNKNGKKFQIKDRNNKKVLEARLAFSTGILGGWLKTMSKITDETKLSIFREITLYTLHDAQKRPVGEISLNTAFFQENPAFFKPFAT